MSLYQQRGVSAQKEDVHKATASLSKGLFEHAFCKLFPDYLGGDDAFVNIMHADGAGTKSILAYLYWKETGDISVWEGIAQDAIVMNLDDLLCVGVCDSILFTSTIGRNKQLIPGEVLQALIGGTQAFFDKIRTEGVEISFLGGETADIGDVVRTVVVDGTMTARWPKNRIVSNEAIRAGDVIVGLASDGQAVYETAYNSGIGSNGLTSARHDVLHKTYAARYPESYDRSLDESVCYIGPHRLSDEISFRAWDKDYLITAGKLLLSPTRTYAPVIKKILEEDFEAVHGIIHCSGGGQTKCMHYLPGPFRVIKDNLFAPPALFNIIKDASGSSWEEMYQVFNMGHRMEIFTTEEKAAGLISISQSFGIAAQVVGRVEASEKKELVLKGSFGEIRY